MALTLLERDSVIQNLRRPIVVEIFLDREIAMRARQFLRRPASDQEQKSKNHCRTYGDI